MIKNIITLFLFSYFILLSSCNETRKAPIENIITPPKGMVWVEGKTFLQGAKSSDQFAMKREKPAHNVTVDGFFIDITEVTNGQFKNFVEATKYTTIAERKIDWEEMKKQLPPGTEKPHDSILQPGSLIFNKKTR